MALYKSIGVLFFFDLMQSDILESSQSCANARFFIIRSVIEFFIFARNAELF